MEKKQVEAAVLITTKEAAELLNCTVEEVRILIKAGAITAKKVSGKWSICDRSVRIFIENAIKNAIDTVVALENNK